MKLLLHASARERPACMHAGIDGPRDMCETGKRRRRIKNCSHIRGGHFHTTAYSRAKHAGVHAQPHIEIGSATGSQNASKRQS